MRSRAGSEIENKKQREKITAALFSAH